MGKLAPVVELDLDKPRHLVFDLNAMCEYEKATGRSITAPGGLSTDMTGMRMLLWACLQHYQVETGEIDENGSPVMKPELTLEQVGKLIHSGNITDVSAALSGLLVATMPEGPPGAAPKARPRSIGRRSGPSGDTTSV